MMHRLFFIATFCLASPLLVADFHVSTNGNDQNPGTPEQPFATLERVGIRGDTHKLLFGRFFGIELTTLIASVPV